MTLINRIVGLFKADAHGILDCLENPHLTLRQAIREMEEQIAKHTGEYKCLLKEEAALKAQRVEADKLQKAAAEQIALCFKTGQDSLAKSAVRRQLEQERLNGVMESRMERLASGREALTARIKEEQERLHEIRQKQEILGAEVEEGVVRPGIPAAGGISEDEVEIAFLREKQKYAEAAVE